MRSSGAAPWQCSRRSGPSRRHGVDRQPRCGDRMGRATLSRPAIVFVPERRECGEGRADRGAGRRAPSRGRRHGRGEGGGERVRGRAGAFFFEDGAEPAQFDGYEPIGDELLDELPDPARSSCRSGTARSRSASSARSPRARRTRAGRGRGRGGAGDVGELAGRPAGRLRPLRDLRGRARGARRDPARRRRAEPARPTLRARLGGGARAAVRAYAEAGIRVEGAAAAPLALARREELPRPLVLIVTGRNVDDALSDRILSATIESRALQRLLTTATLVGLLVATAAAFAITERLKLTKSPISGTRSIRNGSRRRAAAPGGGELRIKLRRATTSRSGSSTRRTATVRTLVGAHVAARAATLPLGRATDGNARPDGTYRGRDPPRRGSTRRSCCRTDPARHEAARVVSTRRRTARVLARRRQAGRLRAIHYALSEPAHVLVYLDGHARS